MRDLAPADATYNISCYMRLFAACQRCQLGEAGLRPLLHEFLMDQLREHKPNTNTDKDGVEDRPEAHVEDQALEQHATSIYGRRMDKGVIIESSNLRPEQQERASRLCNVTQVEESKTLLKMIPMWTTFLVIGLAASTGDTFSSEQVKNLDSTDFTFYIVIFVKPISQATISFLFNKFLTSKKRASKAQLKLGKIIRIWSGMVLCTIFCVVAWLVKVHRLQIVDRKRSNPDKEISSMNIFWLAPQYCLLGLMQGSGTDGLEEFMIDELPKSLKIYASAINGFVIDGIGNFLGILYVNANIQLFSTTMNESRLDKYYLRLLILSFLNMCYYYPVSTIYRPIRHTQADMLERDITINHEV
ncbi:hypothetical protein JRO89_XSUnG0004500 [Xanthoceras sorbifolium]|uniref:Uncharacterized protein n=1 Tax=Xanthoceras sorbifolium TaxID=99658 RepID=A0ABQ8H0D5_9ROSI|nr:hypothetical protein JRO89_XSUnG0004500 [Xanthoceras sorbifolium]